MNWDHENMSFIPKRSPQSSSVLFMYRADFMSCKIKLFYVRRILVLFEVVAHNWWKSNSFCIAFAYGMLLMLFNQCTVFFWIADCHHCWFMYIQSDLGKNDFVSNCLILSIILLDLCKLSARKLKGPLLITFQMGVSWHP